MKRWPTSAGNPIAQPTSRECSGGHRCTTLIGDGHSGEVMDEDKSSATIVSAIIAMGHALGLTAEPLEQPDDPE